MKDLLGEQKEQQRLEDDYWGNGTEPVKQIEEEKDDRTR